MNEINKLLEKFLTEECFKFWKKLEEKIPPVWDRPSSSSGKYHVKDNGYVPSISEHTFEMLYVATELLEIFPLEPKSKDCDILLLSILLHDAFKYGVDNPIFSVHTNSKHDQIVGDIIKDGRSVLSKLFSNEQLNLMEQMVRFHSGKWSTDAKSGFSWDLLNKETFFIHILDMLSSRNLIKINLGNKN